MLTEHEDDIYDLGHAAGCNWWQLMQKIQSASVPSLLLLLLQVQSHKFADRLLKSRWSNSLNSSPPTTGDQQCLLANSQLLISSIPTHIDICTASAAGCGRLLHCQFWCSDKGCPSGGSYLENHSASMHGSLQGEWDVQWLLVPFQTYKIKCDMVDKVCVSGIRRICTNEVPSSKVTHAVFSNIYAWSKDQPD